MLCHKLALTIVGDGRLDGVGLAVVSDAIAGVARDLAQRVGVLAGLFVLDGAHRDLAVGGVLAGGDDPGVLALDELEGELAFLERTPGQNLGRGDLVGDAEALGGHVIGVLEDRLLGVLQLVLDAERAVAVVRNLSHDGVLGGAVGNAVLGGAGLGLAQRVGVLAGLGVRDGVHHDLAVGIVGAGSGNNVTFDELKAELAGHKAKLAPGQDLLRGDLVGDAGVLGTRLVRVGELGLLGGGVQLMLRLERAVTLVGDGGLDGIGLAVVGDAASLALDLAQRVSVRSGLVVFDGTHRDLAAGVVGAGSNNLGVLALALDELKAKLAVLEVAPGQALGRGDFVGDARLDRRHAIGIGERKGYVAIRLARHPQITLAVIGHGEGNRTRRLGVVSHAGYLAGLGHGVGKGVLALFGLLAQNLVEGVERKGDLAKVDLAGRVVGCGRALGHRGAGLVGSHGKGELAGDVGRGQTVSNLQVLDARKRRLGVFRIVGVLELDALDVLGVLQLMRSHQLALAVIADGRHDGVDRFVVGNATGVTLDLMQLVGVLADLSVLDGLERHLAAGVVFNGLDRFIFLVHDFEQLKAELAGRKIAPGQGLGHVNLVGNAGLNRLRSVNVLELVLACFAPSHLHVSAELALLVGRHRHGDLRDVLAVGNAVNRGPSVLLADLVDIRSRCLVFDRAEVNGRLDLIRIVIGHGHSHGISRGLGHRGVVLGRQLKLKRVLFRPGAALEHLGQAEVGLGVHRRRRHVILVADLAVVAQVGIDMRRGRLGGCVVPLGIEHVGGGTGVVAAHALLGGVELVNKCQARSSDTKHQVTVLIGNNRAIGLRSVAADKLDDGGGGLGLAVLALLLKLILVVILTVSSQRALCRLRAFLIRVNGRLLLEAVVAVGVGRLKGRNRITQRTTAPLVRVEIHGIGAVNDGRIMLDVVLEPRDLLGRKQIVECSALHARGVLYADRLSAVDRELAVFVLKVALRNQRRRDADRYDIALLGIVLVSVLHRDKQVFCLAGELVGVGIGFLVERLARLGKRRTVDDGFGKAVDLHKVAQLIGKRNIAGLVRVVTLMDFGRMRCFRRNGL